MSRAYDAKQAALKAYPDDQESAVQLLLDYLDISEDDFKYENGRTVLTYLKDE